jgi:microcystin-dependent protein
MAKTKISEFDSNPVNNTDIDGINLAEGMAPGLVNNAIRELMALLKDFQTGAAGDNVTVGGNLVVTGTGTLSGRAIDAFPSGTKMVFQQTTAPVGWTKDTTHDNKALRVVTGTAGSGGSVNFTTAFGSQNVGATTLTTAQIPVHSHSFSGSTNEVNLSHSHGVNDPSHGHTYNDSWGQARGFSGFPGFDGGGDAWQGVDRGTAGAFTGISIAAALGNHAHSVSGSIGNTGSGNSHTHTLDLSVEYVDLIICTKS